MALAQASCASAPAPRIEPALAHYVGESCPPDRVQIRSARRVGDDTVYVVDACGSLLEIEQGLALPLRRHEVTEITPENPLELPARVKPKVPDRVTEIVRRKVQRWCVLGTPDAAAAERVVFYSATPAEHASCQARLAQSLTPLGSERDLETNGDIYWFSLGQYVFTTTESLYEPPPEHRSIASASAPPDSARRVKVMRGNPGDSRAELEAPSLFYGRIELGLGFLAYPAPDRDRAYEGLAWNTHVEGGGKLARNVGLSALVSTHWGITAPEADRQPRVLTLALAGSLYPDPDAGFVLQAHTGVATLGYGYEFQSFGPEFGGSFGADFGERGKAKTADVWTGGSLQIRGNFAQIDDRLLTVFGLYCGVYYW